MKQYASRMRRIAMPVCVAMALVLLAACGGGRSGGDEQAAASAGTTPRVVPTMPQAQFAMPTTMIQAGGGVTETEAAAEETPTPEAAATPEVDLARGARIYANQDCAECHGAEGEGVADKGSAIAGTSLTEVEFTDLLRTGGDIGPDHLYGPNAISPGGMTTLHAWLQSLPPSQ